MILIVLTFEGFISLRSHLKRFPKKHMINYQNYVGDNGNVGKIVYSGQTVLNCCFDIIDTRRLPPYPTRDLSP